MRVFGFKDNLWWPLFSLFQTCSELLVRWTQVHKFFRISVRSLFRVPDIIVRPKFSSGRQGIGALIVHLWISRLVVSDQKLHFWDLASPRDSDIFDCDIRIGSLKVLIVLCLTEVELLSLT